MITSGSEYVGLARSGVASFTGLGEDNRGYIGYDYLLPVSQTVSVLSPAIGGRIATASVTDYVALEGGRLVILNTSVSFLGFTFALAFFLALTIDWGTREPIIWTLRFSSEEYTSPFTLPVFSNPLSYSFIPPQSSISSTLRTF